MNPWFDKIAWQILIPSVILHSHHPWRSDDFEHQRYLLMTPKGRGQESPSNPCLGDCSTLSSSITAPALFYLRTPVLMSRSTSYIHVIVLRCSRSLFQTRLYRLLPWSRTSCVLAVVSAMYLSPILGIFFVVLNNTS